MPAQNAKPEEIARHLPPLESGTRRRDTSHERAAHTYGIPPVVSWSEFDFDASSSPAPGDIDLLSSDDEGGAGGERCSGVTALNAPAADSPYAVIHGTEESALRSRDSSVLLELIDTYLAGEHGVEEVPSERTPSSSSASGNVPSR